MFNTDVCITICYLHVFDLRRMKATTKILDAVVLVSSLLKTAHTTSNTRNTLPTALQTLQERSAWPPATGRRKWHFNLHRLHSTIYLGRCLVSTRIVESNQ